MNSKVEQKEVDLQKLKKIIQVKAEQLKDLDVRKQITDTQTILIVGPRKSGKTTLILHLMIEKNLDSGFVMCPTPEIYKSYGGCIVRPYCWNFFDERTLARVTRIQENIRTRLDEVWKQQMALIEAKAYV